MKRHHYGELLEAVPGLSGPPRTVHIRTSPRSNVRLTESQIYADHRIFLG